MDQSINKPTVGKLEGWTGKASERTIPKPADAKTESVSSAQGNQPKRESSSYEL